MAYQAHISIKGTTQGQFKGEGIQDSRKDKWIPVLSFSNEVQSPRDLATGYPSGKRQWSPVKIVKEWGAASPQGLAACVTNETLTEVNIEFTKTKDSGEEYVYQKIKLTNATVAAVRRFTGNSETGETTSRHASAHDTLELEEWALTFSKIELDDIDGQTSFMDDWRATK
ncbi:MAG: type VI secretion system tube protein TssD [Polyangiaceae bacterium]|jgi:type VI secretion system secreted protein Hcp